MGRYIKDRAEMGEKGILEKNNYHLITLCTGSNQFMLIYATYLSYRVFSIFKFTYTFEKGQFETCFLSNT